MLADSCANICHCHSTLKRILPNGLILLQEMVADNRNDKAPIFIEYLIHLGIMLRGQGAFTSAGNWMTCSGLNTP